MAKSSEDISRAIRAKLKVIDPDISTEPLTPERKIIDTVSETIAESQVDAFVLNYNMDIDSKFGEDLDKFVALWGFARQGGRRATGTVTFSRALAADRDIVIPIGTQVMKPASSISPVVIFQTTATVVLYVGTTEVEAPIEAQLVGAIGNVAAGTILGLGSGAVGDISSTSNENATTGGTEIESDAELRVRFKNTIFRNISGTQDQYLALSISSRFAKKANVIGPVSRFVEYLQIDNDTPTTSVFGAISEIPYSKYTYDFDYFVTDGDLLNEIFYSPKGVHYTFNPTEPPSISVVNNDILPQDLVILMEHAYCSINSRNDPATGLANYVDVYVSGQDVTLAIESCTFPTSLNNIVNTPGNSFHKGNWARFEDGAEPVVGNRIQELLWQPVTSLPTTLSVDNNTYALNTDYWLVRDTTVLKGSKRARNAVEWSSGLLTSLANKQFEINYNFDKLPLTINELLDSHKQVTTDVLVHTAQERYFKINLIIMYTPGFAPTSVDSAITAALGNWMERLNFGAVIQMSDILDVVHDVPGVDNVRLALPADDVPYGVVEIALDGVTPISYPYTTDFAIQDSDLPILNSVVTTKRSQNTWT